MATKARSKTAALGTNQGGGEMQKKTDEPLTYSDPKPDAIAFGNYPIRDIAINCITEPIEPQCKVRTEKVEELAKSLAEAGLINPITVRLNPDSKSSYKVIAGKHRLRAAKKLKWPRIKCWVKDDLDTKQALLVEIDENLMRVDLTSEERSLHTQARKQVWDKEAEVSRQSGAKPKSGPKGGRPKGFTSEVAAKTGRSQRSVQRDLKLIDPETGKRCDPETGKPVEKAKPVAKTNGGTKEAVGYFNVPPGINAARKHYLQTCEADAIDCIAEADTIVDALHEIEGRRR